MKHMRRAFSFILFLVILFAAAGCGGSETLPDDPFYGNLTNASKVFRDSEYLYFANPYDDFKLYRYDSKTDTPENIGGETGGVMYIFSYEGYIYFSARVGNAESAYNVYRTKGEGAPETVLENAVAVFAADGQLIYRDFIDPFEYDIFRYDFSTKESVKLFDRELSVDESNLCYADGRLYFSGGAYAEGENKIYVIDDLKSGAYRAINEQPFNTAINCLQYRGGSLYFYRDYDESAIVRYDIAKGEFENVFVMKDGDFDFYGLIVNNDYIYFSGRQNSAEAEGEEYVEGSFVYDLETKDLRELPEPLGPGCFVVNDFIYNLRGPSYGQDEFALKIFDTADASDISSLFPTLTEKPAG
ncbi:MAG: DUF5050 domain-containing protein [Eubacteriales bacterium]|jgi:hypothetical protein